jgi:hypothetical protein
VCAERLPDAETAVSSVKDAVGQLVAARSRWEQVAAETMSLLRLAGRSTAHVPKLPSQLEQLTRDARRARDIEVPLPVPGVPQRAEAVNPGA